jgi:hypothetical protein
MEIKPMYVTDQQKWLLQEKGLKEVKGISIGIQQWEVVKWLLEKHQIWITITSISQESWQWHITKPGDSLGKLYEEDFYTPEEAYSAAFDYVLKELI